MKIALAGDHHSVELKNHIKKYLDKNGKRIWVGEVRHRVLMTINGYKSSDNRQPNLRLSVMPYRAQQDNSEDVGELDGEDAETPF